MYRLLFITFFLIANTHATLEDLENLLKQELEYINYGKTRWKNVPRAPEQDKTLDVVIIGGGLSGLSAAVALMKEGVSRIKIFDENISGEEGPWITYAKMKHLRSTKRALGPALDIPHLTFQAWYTAKYGQESYDTMSRVTKENWMEYLVWYREVMNLSVENGCKLERLHPTDLGFELHFSKNGTPFIIEAPRVVIATGRFGFGGASLPAFTQQLPKDYYAHTSERIDYDKLKDKDVGIIGCGASAFDATNAALASGAKTAKILMRREFLPTYRAFSQFSDWVYHIGYYGMNDAWKWDLYFHLKKCGIPPQAHLVREVNRYVNFSHLSECSISNATIQEDKLMLETSHGNLPLDYLIFATGAHVDGKRQPELSAVIDNIALWSDKIDPALLAKMPSLGKYPYLGPSFEFLEKHPGAAPYLSHLYCFNYAACLTHGHITAEIVGCSTGADRLAKGIASAFFEEIFGDLHLDIRFRNRH